MRSAFKLNKWQRAILLVSAVGILTATAVQAFYDGFDGIGWVLPTGVSVTLACFALSNLKDRARSPRERSSTKAIQAADLVDGMGLCAAKIYPLLPMPSDRYHDGVESALVAQLLAESLIHLRAAVYAYIVVAVTAVRLDPNFIKSEGAKVLSESYLNIAKKGWLRRFGNDVVEFPNDQARSDFATEAARCSKIYMQVSEGFHRGSQRPFTPLYRYIQMDISAKTEDLEAKFGPNTRELMQNLKDRWG